jgi:hypothetical protein
MLWENWKDNKKEDKNSLLISVRLPQKLLYKLQLFNSKHGLTISEGARGILEVNIDRYIDTSPENLIITLKQDIELLEKTLKEAKK